MRAHPLDRIRTVRQFLAIVVAVTAFAVLLPVGVRAVASDPVYITDASGSSSVRVSENGELVVTADEKYPLPVRGVVGAVPAPSQPQLLRRLVVSTSEPRPLFGPLDPDVQIAVTSLIYANTGGTNAEAELLGYSVTGPGAGCAARGAEGPSLMVVSVPTRDTVVVPLPQPLVAPRRVFPLDWCLGVRVFGGGEVTVTAIGYQL